MLYKKRTQTKLTDELFKNPTAEYRGAPFWAWNCKLDGEELLRQIDIFKAMGLGGFHMHSRAGLATPYMGEEFMSLVELCNKKAIENEMICFLYDEDRWPSGAAGGRVTKDHAYRMRFLIFCPYGYPFDEVYPAGARYLPSGNRKLLGRYRVTLEDGFLKQYEALSLSDPLTHDTDNIWEAYLDYAGDSPWFNDQAYPDTLNKKAIARFIEETHVPYKARMGEYFGQSIPAIFTDEPQFSNKQTLTRSDARTAVTMPFTDDFEDTYRQVYGESILDHLPELLWELPDAHPSKARYQYHDHICERFTTAFIDNIGEWCEKNGIMLTGHMMAEENLFSQTKVMGETMRGYRTMQLPGIDMLCDRREYSTAKQCQSAARQYGREGVLSELYGVTNWDFDFRGHKLQGDWQAALGVTLRVHHLTWVTMAGEAKRDYPACIGYQSPWHTEYAYVEDHFARLNTALTRGKAIARVAVVHPVEGFWLNFGPNDKTAQARAEMEVDFENIIKWLLFSQIDFDFLSESLLPDLYTETNDKKFTVGQMAYDVVLVPNCLSMRSTTLKALKRFQAAGGCVVFAGEAPKIMDGKLSSDASVFAQECVQVPFAKTHIINALEPFRDISIQKGDGSQAEHLLYQLRKDGEDHWLFICNGTKPHNEDLPYSDSITLSIKGEYAPTLYDTIDGSISPLQAAYRNGMTIIKTVMHMHDSLLLNLTKGRSAATPQAASAAALASAFESTTFSPSVHSNFMDIDPPHAFELAEPNVLVLDLAEYAFNSGPWQPLEEILRIDNLFRNQLGYPLRMQSLSQPWTLERQPDSGNILSLRFKIPSKTTMDKAFLALENPEGTEIIWNGVPVNKKTEGYYVDRSIKKIRLPGLTAGDNELILKIKFEQRTNIEAFYLLGQFGVELNGKLATITDYPKSLSFGDISRQGLPFYGGNVTYKCRIYSNGNPALLEATYFRAPLLRVTIDGIDKGIIAYAPYHINLGYLAEGRHELEITAYGNRINTFGTLHNADEKLSWVGPNAWRSENYDWSYEYVLKPTGILKAPRLTFQAD
ncbi:MAG: hypothetical protein FWD03_07360 [Defluviitaleaceae bacterium]|nr:hypothetical protein [Defluviitaleaceae bacterium]